MFKSAVMALDRAGLRPLVARAANLAYSGHNFCVDGDGDWVHEMPEGVIVSPVPHTAPFAHFERWVADNWLWKYKPKQGDVIVDLGTGVGEEAVIFSPMIGPTGIMLAVEAHPTVFRCLQKTVAGLSNVRPVNVAVGDRNGEIEIDEGASFLTGSVFGKGRKVPMVTLDELTKDLPRIDFLRTNIEGAERLMLSGMTEAVGKIRNLCISCHDFIGRPARSEVIALLRHRGFEISRRPNTPAPMCDYVYARCA